MNLSKEKIRKIVAESAKKHGVSDKNILLITDVVDDVLEEVEKEYEQAVRGLLEDIEIMEEERTEDLSQILKGTIKEKAVNRGALYGWNEALSWVKQQIEKWFPVEENDRRKD